MKSQKPVTRLQNPVLGLSGFFAGFSLRRWPGADFYKIGDIPHTKTVNGFIYHNSISVMDEPSNVGSIVVASNTNSLAHSEFRLPHRSPAFLWVALR